MNKPPKPRRCKVCETVFTPKQFLQATCDYKCAITYSKKLKDNKAAAEWKIEKKALSEKLKTLGQYEADAKKSFQKWIRMRDKDENCISCDGNDKDLWDGGHFKKAEIYSGVIFNPANCHKQCRKCNRFLGGNELMYRQGLIKRYGLEYTENIENLANETRQYKYTKSELIAKKLKYDLLIKEMK
jgi:hypothetical protein